MYSPRLLLALTTGCSALALVAFSGAPANAACFGTTLFPCNAAGYFVSSQNHHHGYRSEATYSATPAARYYYTAPVAHMTYAPTISYQPVSYLQTVTVARPVTRIVPVTTYRAVTSYEPVQVRQVVTHYRPVATYSPTYSYGY